MKKHEREAYDNGYVLTVLHAAHPPFVMPFELGERISSVSESMTLNSMCGIGHLTEPRTLKQCPETHIYMQVLYEIIQCSRLVESEDVHKVQHQ